MKTRFVLIVISAFLLMSRPGHAATDTSRDPVSTAVPDAPSRSLELINRERLAAGLPSLGLDDEVTKIAARWSRDMAAEGRLSHNDDYFSPESLKALNATVLGENVAYADTVETIHEILMKSPPHRRNILHRDYQLVGIAAVVADDGLMYLTQDFLTRQSTTAADATPDGPAPPARDRDPKPPRGEPTPPRARPAEQRRRPPARPTRTAAGAVRPAAPARPPATVPAAAPAEASAQASEPAPGPAAPSPAAPPVPASTPHSNEPVASAPAPTETALPPPAAPVVDHSGEAEPQDEDSSPWSRVGMLEGVPLLALALRPRPTRLSG